MLMPPSKTGDALVQLRARLRHAQIERARRWRDPDRGRPRRAVRLRQDKLPDKGASIMVVQTVRAAAGLHPSATEETMTRIVALMLAACLAIAVPAHGEEAPPPMQPRGANQLPLVHAGDLKWHTDCRHGRLTMYFDPEGPNDENPPVEFNKSEAGAAVIISYDAFRKLLEDLPTALRAFKACEAYRKCLDDRDAGKVKHCLSNDRRWRDFISGAW
jgi:hypothetical protein